VNFFEHQAQARRRSARYVALFMLATAAIVAMVNLVVLTLVAYFVSDYDNSIVFRQWLGAHPRVLWWTTLGTLTAIGGASLYRIATLSSGGAAVAKTLGATLVDSSTNDPRLRQLLNVVEELAIAAGVPVPQVFVLDSEIAVNAFASGFTASDAAVTVTRGALTHLTRDELQGVIGHEFSHVFNGDMRLNTRLIGVLFGILFIGLTGRLILRARVDGRGAAPIWGAALAFILIGYVGLLFGRMIQAAISRSRESLADASAVQFTRDPHGLSGALKKIAVLSGVMQDPRSEQVSHMLIASRFSGERSLFATHPPILERIRALEPNFRASELAHISREPVAPLAPMTAPAVTVASPPLKPTQVIAAIGQLSDTALVFATDRRDAIPPPLLAAAREPSEAAKLVMGLVLSDDSVQRAPQIAMLREQPDLPAGAIATIESFARDIAALNPALRLPLFELSFPALRRRTPEELRQLATLVEKLCRVDNRVTVFEYALARLLRLQLYEVLAPRARRTPIVAPKLFALRAEAQSLLSVLARESTGDAKVAQGAYDAGMRRLFQMQALPYVPSVDWVALDRALMRLDLLAPLAKQELIEALVLIVGYDGTVSLAEMELLRTVCASLHCPLPPLPTSRPS
jgi:Zn-dependent protease with chaperone function